MTTYTITLNGKMYEVSIEKKSAAASPAMTPTAVAAASVTPVAPPAAPVAAAPAKPAAAAAAGDGNRIQAPMPGKVIAVKTKVGDSVKAGQELLIVEAMKMNNPILASTDGIVKEIYVNAGDPIQTGAPLILIV